MFGTESAVLNAVSATSRYVGVDYDFTCIFSYLIDDTYLLDEISLMITRGIFIVVVDNNND